MDNKRRYTFIALSVAILFVIYVVVTYNSLIRKDEKVKLQWNEVQNTYQRRLELVPQLVGVVKGGANFEQTTLQKIAEARAKAAGVSVNSISANSYQEQTAVQDELADAANRLVITIENYPNLKGTKAFIGLQVELEGTERRIKVARKDFNDAIAVYNSSVRSFPAKIVAGTFGFKPKDGFQANSGADTSVEIKF